MKKTAPELVENTPIPETPHREEQETSPVASSSATLLNLSLKSTLRFWLIGAVVVMLGYRFYQTLELIYLIFSALIIAFSIERIVLWLEKRLKSRSLSIAISYFALFVFVFSGVIFVIPFFVSQVSYLISWTSSLIVSVQNFILSNSRPAGIQNITWLPDFAKAFLLEHRNDLPWDSKSVQPTLVSGLNSLLNASTTSLKQFSLSIVSAIGGLFSVLTNIMIVFTTAVFFSLEKEYLIKLFLKFGKSESKARNLQKITNIYQKLSLWLKARIFLSLFVTVSMYIAFWILSWCGLQLPSIFSLSLITGLLDIIPYVGPFLSVIPVVLLALIHHGRVGMLIAGVIFLAIQWVQNNIITPILMEKQLGTNSILIIVSALLGAVIMGFWGVILSVPLAVIIGLFLDEEE